MSEAIEAEVVPQHPTRWRPGQSGNPKGRPPKGDALADLLRAHLETVHPAEASLALREGRPARTIREVIVDKVTAKAMMGQDRSIELIWKYIDGKPTARVEHSGEVKHTGRIDHDHVASIDDAMNQLRVIREQREARELEAQKKRLQLTESTE